MSVKLSSINKEWIKTKGFGVSIGVCDSGIEEGRSEFNGSLTKFKQFGNKTSITNLHGNHISGIMFGTSICGNTTSGFCPKSSAYVSGFGMNSKDSLKNLTDSIAWLSQFDLDVLNLSLSYDKNDSSIGELLQKIHQRGCWIFAAFTLDRKYPWSYDFVSSVNGKVGKGVDIAAYNECYSIGIGEQPSFMRGSSISCAIVSGVAGLYRAYNKKKTIEDFKKEIDGDNFYKPTIHEKKKKRIIMLGD